MGLFVLGLPFAASGFTSIAAAEALVFAIVALVALLFMVTTIRDGVRALREDRAKLFIPDAHQPAEQVNVVAGIFAEPHEVAVLWSAEQSCDR